MKIFIDTGPLYALVSPKDQFHQKIITISQQLQNQPIKLITTDYILNEVFTKLLGRHPNRYPRIQKFNQLIFQSKLSQIVWIGQQRFIKTKKLFLKFSQDKLWSFTDCTSYVVMKELKIDTIFTFDEHFKQMGFRILG